ncbi:YkvA family protein [Polaromonas sp. LjRoot131]|jgi:uncharacterized membrane protein YkvA (DUF1232 family)|uniref:YkvA family protein n=1 Tax=Polaromonas sp. LjRoot131 TaxID=3342262 RepID=UPI003ECD3FCA
MEARAYFDANFWEKVKNFALRAGRNVIEKALWLYYAAQRPDTPAWARTVIYSALVYFISPVDAIPDITPVVGYVDDLGVLAAAFGMVGLHIDDTVREETQKKLAEWFG